MEKYQTCPAIPTELLDHLQEIFPDVTVNPSNTNPWEAYGTARVIRYLQEKHAEQEGTCLVST